MGSIFFGDMWASLDLGSFLPPTVTLLRTVKTCPPEQNQKNEFVHVPLWERDCFSLWHSGNCWLTCFFLAPAWRHSYLKITVVGSWCICAYFVVKNKESSCMYVCRYYSSFWRAVWNSHLYNTESLGWEVLCPEGSSSESDSQRWACKGGIRFLFVPLRFWVDIGVFNSLMWRGKRLIS